MKVYKVVSAMIRKIGKSYQSMIIMMLLVAVVCYAESNLKQYAADLDKKQQLLNSIHEDSDIIASGMVRIAEKQDMADVAKLRKPGTIVISAEDLSNMMAPTTKISVTPPSMAGTLLPESNPKIIRHTKEGPSEDSGK